MQKKNADLPTESTFSTHVTNPQPCDACTLSCSTLTSSPTPGGSDAKTISHDDMTCADPEMHADPGWRHCTCSPTPHTRRMPSMSLVRNAW